MAEPSRRTAWGNTKPKVSSDDQTSDTNSTSVRPYDFPPLGSVGPSKSASRKRAVYAPQRTRFEAYPPRQEIIGQRQQMQDEFGIPLDEEAGSDLPSITAQQNGMSSVTVYDQTGKRVSNGPDIYSRYGKRHVKGKQKVIDSEIGEAQEMQENGDSIGFRDVIEVRDLPPPLHLTPERIDLLIAESQRRKRATAAVLRQNGTSGANDSQIQYKDDPLLEQMSRAFSSVDSFIKAFGKQDLGQ
ncbi:uncharacterized protein FA14DRAFT_162578 [Meira miltonrushii]|uniref:Uncharacterized protein n=1 Tax=Meira miltonrushii TaxID=1280837 RepID=A0A316V273_9BASI|nr:uncharacterized protein FA14DRAFT_162578 [Meira miltonrushii]PWN31610.1 hypothetical protein FA14DRAFT_162578 [Meira miltonrushii]